MNMDRCAVHCKICIHFILGRYSCAQYAPEVCKLASRTAYISIGWLGLLPSSSLGKLDFPSCLLPSLSLSKPEFPSCFRKSWGSFKEK